MLGAQARAAELQAAKSAAMRQRVHREAEEQSIPSNTASVSLTDFARSSLLSKNKGTKAFRPLHNSDFDIPDDQADCTFPTRHCPTLPTPSRNNYSITASENPPTAPRAMLSQLISVSARQSSSQTNNPSFLNHDRSPLMMQKVLSKHEGLDLASQSPNDEISRPTSTYIYGPDDLSPIKQEIKVMACHSYCDSTSPVRASNQQILSPVLSHMQELTPCLAQSSVMENWYRDFYTQLPFDPYMYNGPALSHFHPENPTSTANRVPSQSQIEQIRLFADDVSHHQSKLRAQPQLEFDPDEPTSLLHCDQPYDRNSRMQSFVAAQQAMARKGKTVLHNPDLYRPASLPPMEQLQFNAKPVTRSTVVSIDSSDTKYSFDSVSPADGRARITKNRHHEQLRHLKPDLGIEESNLPSTCIVQSGRNQKQISSLDVETIPQTSINSVSEDWCNLHPITVSEKIQLRIRMDKLARDEAADLEVPVLGNSTVVVGQASQHWLQSQVSQSSGRQSTLEHILRAHENKSNKSLSHGVIGRPVSNENIELRYVSLTAVANVMFNLYDRTDEHTRKSCQVEYTAAPSYAVERKTLPYPFMFSLFDDIAVATGRV